MSRRSAKSRTESRAEALRAALGIFSEFGDPKADEIRVALA